ncbi:MAG: HNH endonuclease [Pseudomonadota bacterium]
MISKYIPKLQPYYCATEEGQIIRKAYTYKSKMPNGKIRKTNMSEKVLGGTCNSQKGYLRVHLEGKTYFIHTLVALAFLGPSNGRQVNHIDGNKHNNSPSNLEYVTNQQNRDHAVRMNLHPNRSNGFCKITKDDVIVIKKSYEQGMTQKELAKVYKVCQQTISKVLKVQTVPTKNRVFIP